MTIKQFGLNRASEEDAKWLKETLNRECLKFKERVELTDDESFRLQWQSKKDENYDAIHG